MSDPIYGPQVKRPLRVRVLQLASLVLAVAGLILLYLYSVNRDIPTVRIADITPTMNFAYVKVSGAVTRDAYLFKSGGVIFNLHDGSGEIAVMGGRTQAEALEKSGKLPRTGDRVDVAGSLSVSANQDVKLRMQSADQLILQRKVHPASFSLHRSAFIPLSTITLAQQGDIVSVVGTLKKISIPKPGSKAPYVLTLEEDGAELAVIFWDNVFQGLEQKLPTLGKNLRARGRVDVYKEAIQLKVWEAADLREINEQEASRLRHHSNVESNHVANVYLYSGNVHSSTTHMSRFPHTGKRGYNSEKNSDDLHNNESERAVHIADITAEQKGEVFTVVGTLGEPKSIRGGVIYPIADASGKMVVLFWDKQVSGEERDALESGVRLHVTAPLEVYKGVLELIPEDVGAFRVEQQ